MLWWRFLANQISWNLLWNYWNTHFPRNTKWLDLLGRVILHFLLFSKTIKYSAFFNLNFLIKFLNTSLRSKKHRLIPKTDLIFAFLHIKILTYSSAIETAFCELSISPFLNSTWAKVFQQSPFVGLSFICISKCIHFYWGTPLLIFSMLAGDPGFFLWGTAALLFTFCCSRLDHMVFTCLLLKFVNYFQEIVDLRLAFLDLIGIAIIFPFWVKIYDSFLYFVHHS